MYLILVVLCVGMEETLWALFTQAPLVSATEVPIAAWAPNQPGSPTPAAYKKLMVVALKRQEWLLAAALATRTYADDPIYGEIGCHEAFAGARQSIGANVITQPNATQPEHNGAVKLLSQLHEQVDTPELSAALHPPEF